MQQANIKVESRTIQNHRKEVLETSFPFFNAAVRYRPMSANGRPIGRYLKRTFTTLGRRQLRAHCRRQVELGCCSKAAVRRAHLRSLAINLLTRRGL